MAKVKQGFKNDMSRGSKPTKKNVSTSRIFKKFKKQASPKLEHGKQKLTRRQPLQEKEVPRKHKRQVTPEHPLATEFNEAIEGSRTQIQKDSDDFVKATIDELCARVDKINSNITKQIEADAAADEPFFKPLGDEELTFTNKEGTQVGSASLAARMKKFEKFIAKEEKELESLLQQFEAVRQEIVEEAEENFGPEWAKAVRGRTRDVSVEGQEGLAEDLEKIHIYFAGLIDEAGEKAMEEMRISEKDFKIRLNKDKQRFMDIMQDDD